MDVDKQVAYWRDSAEEDWAVARELLAGGRPRHGLFFAQLGLEKLLKAHVSRYTHDLPPRVHSLVRRAQLAALRPSPAQLDTLADMSAFNIEGRYPETLSPAPTLEEAQAYLQRAQEVWEWLKSLL
jgi:HEPN domain-containing protein